MMRQEIVEKDEQFPVKDDWTAVHDHFIHRTTETLGHRGVPG
jgi:hypothetical protein